MSREDIAFWRMTATADLKKLQIDHDTCCSLPCCLGSSPCRSGSGRTPPWSWSCGESLLLYFFTQDSRHTQYHWLTWYLHQFPFLTLLINHGGGSLRGAYLNIQGRGNISHLCMVTIVDQINVWLTRQSRSYYIALKYFAWGSRMKIWRSWDNVKPQAGRWFYWSN